MKFGHLALPVLDVDRAWAFYRDVLGIEGATRRVDDGLLVTTADGFVLALLHGDPPGNSERMHFGFGLESVEDVQAVRQRLLDAGVREVERIEMDGFSSMKFLDPDGYVVEVFWEAD